MIAITVIISRRAY